MKLFHFKEEAKLANVKRKEVVKGFDDYLKQKPEGKSTFSDEFDKYLRSQCFKNDQEFDIDKFSWYKKVLGLMDTPEEPSFLIEKSPPKSEMTSEKFNVLEMETFSWYKNLLDKLGPSAKDEFEDVYVKDTNIKKLGKEIKRLRESQGWSTAKLAELSQMSLGFINQLENGKASLPKASNLTKLAKIFCVNPDTFLCLAGYIKHEPEIEQDWRISIKNKLSDMGIKGNYINEVIDYIEIVQIKQERQEALEEKN